MRSVMKPNFDALPADVRAQIQAQYGGAQVVLTDTPYYSCVRFAGVRAAGPPVLFTIDTTTRVAFSYGIGQPMTSAGFASGTNATQAETNLLQGSQTRDQADVWIYGATMNVTPDSDPVLAAQVVRKVFANISLNGTMQIPMGRIEQYPGGGGLYGAGSSALRQPDLATPGSGLAENGAGAIVPFFQNGNPMNSNFKRFACCLIWAGVGSGTDSALGVSLTPSSAIVATCGLVRAATTGVSAYTPPAAAGDPGTYVDVVVALRAVSVQPRSQNT